MPKKATRTDIVSWLPLPLAIVAVLLILQQFVVHINLPTNTATPPTWTVNMSSEMYDVSIVGCWVGVVLLICSLALVLKKQ